MFSHGGGFESGASSSVVSETSVAQGVFYQGANLVKRSLEMNQPIVFASIQYRLAHFGFTASKEFEQAGITNLGFEDQRNAFRWVQQNIAQVRIVFTSPRGSYVPYSPKHSSCLLQSANDMLVWRRSQQGHDHG